MSNMKTLDQTAATSTLDLGKVTLGLKVKTGLKAGGDEGGEKPAKAEKGGKKKKLVYEELKPQDRLRPQPRHPQREAVSHRVAGIGLGRWPLRGKLAPMMGRASGVEGVFLPALLFALVGCAGPRPAPIESAAPPPALSATAADTTPEPPAPLPPDALDARSSSAPASPPPAPVASAPSAGLGAAPGCGAFASKFTEARAGAQALVYYERTLRRLVRDWGRKVWQGPQAATASYIDSMAVSLPRVEHVRRASGAEARAATQAAPGRPLSQSLVCGGSAAGERFLWVVSLYLNERSRPVPPDSGVWLDVYVDELSGEVVQVVHLPLG